MCRGMQINPTFPGRHSNRVSNQGREISMLEYRRHNKKLVDDAAHHTKICNFSSSFTLTEK